MGKIKEKGKDVSPLERIKELFWIFGFSLAGELAHHLLPLPVPASIYGLLGLLAALKAGWLHPAKVERTADFLVEIMPLLFVPAGVGLVASWGGPAPRAGAGASHHPGVHRAGVRRHRRGGPAPAGQKEGGPP